MVFSGFSKTPKHPGYQPEEGDIAVSALVDVHTQKGASFRAEPVYFIRENRPYNLKAHLAEEGLHLRFTAIDPVSETLTLLIAKEKLRKEGIPIQIATDSLRTDWIVLQAIEFPGISLFWLGSSMMMLGFLLSMAVRMRKKTASKSQPA